jgi:hypothetical protein
MFTSIYPYSTLLLSSGAAPLARCFGQVGGLTRGKRFVQGHALLRYQSSGLLQGLFLARKAGFARRVHWPTPHTPCRRTRYAIPLEESAALRRTPPAAAVGLICHKRGILLWHLK